MKKLFIGTVVLGLGMVLSSCAEMKSFNLESITKQVPAINKKVPAGTVMGGVDFKSGEVLCASYENKGLKDNEYRVATVATSASPQTNNQAEVIFIRDGEKKWTHYVIPSHKADKSEITLGRIVFRPYHHANADEMETDQYRKNQWYLQRVTSVDEIFKGIVEVDGRNSNIKWLRIPDQAIE